MGKSGTGAGKATTLLNNETEKDAKSKGVMNKIKAAKVQTPKPLNATSGRG